MPHHESDAPDTVEDPASDAEVLSRIARGLEPVIISLDQAVRDLAATTPVLNTNRVRTELLDHRRELQRLRSTVAKAARVLIDDAPIGTPDRPVLEGAGISPHQLEMLAEAAAEAEHTQTSPSRVYQVHFRPSHPDELAYERALRNELGGLEVGSQTFWAAVESEGCPRCEATPFTPCVTATGWPSDEYHKARREAAARTLGPDPDRSTP